MSNIVGAQELAARRHEIGRAIRNRHYEETESGIFLPRCGGISAHGSFEVEVNGRNRSIEPNIVTNAGMNYLLGALAGSAAISAWYVAPFSGNITPVVTQTTSDFPTVCTEATAYASATRPAWAYDAVASQAIANDAVRASFTINSGINVWGAAIVSVSTKSATTGTLFAYSKFGAVRPLIADDVLTIKYTVSATSS